MHIEIHLLSLTVFKFVDLSKLRKASLKRYKKHFNLDVKADSKTELLEAVGRHFAQMPVREADVAVEFYNFIRGVRLKRSPQQQQAQPPTQSQPQINVSPSTTCPPSQPQQQQHDSADDSLIIQHTNDTTRPNPNQHQNSHQPPLVSQQHQQQQAQQSGSAVNGNGVAGMSRSPTPSNSVAVSPALPNSGPSGMHGASNTNGPAIGVTAHSRRINNSSAGTQQQPPPTLVTGSGGSNTAATNGNGTSTPSHTLSTRLTATASASGR